MTPGLTTRTALTLFAARAGDHNDRAMQAGPLLAQALAQRLGASIATVGTADAPLNTGWQVELDAARPSLLALQQRYQQLLAADLVPVTALSRCAVALATLPAVVQRHPDTVVVWFDAHADINTPASTTSGYLGGLALSGPLGLWDSGLGQGLASANAILVGARDIDPFEQDLIDQGVVQHIAPEPDLAVQLQQAVAGRPVYVHFDCDVLEPGIVPTDYRVPHGLQLADVHQAATVLALSPVRGLEISELEMDADAPRTQAAIARLLDALQPLLHACATKI